MYTYDNNGNILTDTTYNYSTALVEDLTHYKEQHEYYYSPNSDKLMQIVSRVLNDSNEYVETIKNFDYDEIGNAKVWNGKTATYSKGRQLASFDTTTFTYNGLGQRTSKTKSGTTINFTYGSSGKLIGQSNGLEFIYDQSGVSGFMYNGNIYHYAKNLQKDIVKILDNDGNIVVKYIYDAWGNYAVEADTQVTKQGTTDKISLAELNPFRYRSYFYDVETELYYLKTRYYDPKIGRFITIDDTQYLAPDQINGLNLYAYCLNNPISYIDPNGTDLEYFNKLLTSYDTLVFLTEASSNSFLARCSYWVKTEIRPNNIGPGKFEPARAAKLAKLSKVSNVLKNASTVMSVIGVAFAVSDGIKNDIARGYSTDRIISNAVVNTVVYGGSAFIIGAAGSAGAKIGALLGTALPGVGNLVGAVVGFGVGVAIGYLLSIDVNGKSVLTNIQDGFYDFWNWLF